MTAADQVAARGPWDAVRIPVLWVTGARVEDPPVVEEMQSPMPIDDSRTLARHAAQAGDCNVAARRRAMAADGPDGNHPTVGTACR